MAKRTDYNQTPETLKQAILIMQDKLQEHEEEFLTAPLSIEVEMGDGRSVTRANPVVQEYRAMVRDFSSALRAYRDLIGEEQAGEVNSLDNIRAMFKVAK